MLVQDEPLLARIVIMWAYYVAAHIAAKIDPIIKFLSGIPRRLSLYDRNSQMFQNELPEHTRI